MSDTLEAPIGDPDAPPEVPEEPQEPTTQELIDAALEKQSQQFQSWQGRRDKAFMEEMGKLIETKTPKEPPGFDFENPTQFVETIMDQKLTKRETEAQQFTQSVVTEAGRIMATDDLYQDQELGNEVVAVIEKKLGKIRRDVNPEISAELLVSSALKDVYKARKKQKKTGLDGNKPTKDALGTVSPSGGAPKKSVKIPKLSEAAQRLAKNFNYKEEDLARVFGK